MLYEYSNLFKGAYEEELNQIRNIYYIYCEPNYAFYIYSIAFTGFGVYRKYGMIEMAMNTKEQV